MRTLKVSVLAAASFALALVPLGCKPEPQFTGRWVGSGTLNAITAGQPAFFVYPGTPDRKGKIPVTVALTLNETDSGGLTGVADVSYDGKEVHEPITGGFVKKGKILLEASEASISPNKLTLTGTATAAALTVQAALKLDTDHGIAATTGSITLKPTG